MGSGSSSQAWWLSLDDAGASKHQLASARPLQNTHATVTSCPACSLSDAGQLKSLESTSQSRMCRTHTCLFTTVRCCSQHNSCCLWALASLNFIHLRCIVIQSGKLNHPFSVGLHHLEQISLAFYVEHCGFTGCQHCKWQANWCGLTLCIRALYCVAGQPRRNMECSQLATCLLWLCLDTFEPWRTRISVVNVSGSVRTHGVSMLMVLQML
jgi:hypothetical protein